MHCILSSGTDHWFKEFCAVLSAPGNTAIATSADLWMQTLIFSSLVAELSASHLTADFTVAIYWACSVTLQAAAQLL